MKCLSITSLLLTLFSAQWVAADTLRCKGKVLVEGMTQAEVLLTCGEPMLKEHIAVIEKGVSTTIKETVPSTSTSAGSAKLNTKQHYHTTVEQNVERWTYNFGSGQLLEYITFTGGKLTDIEEGERID